MTDFIVRLEMPGSGPLWVRPSSVDGIAYAGQGQTFIFFSGTCRVVEGSTWKIADKLFAADGFEPKTGFYEWINNPGNPERVKEEW